MAHIPPHQLYNVKDSQKNVCAKYLIAREKLESEKS